VGEAGGAVEGGRGRDAELMMRGCRPTDGDVLSLRSHGVVCLLLRSEFSGSEWYDKSARLWWGETATAGAE